MRGNYHSGHTKGVMRLLMGKLFYCQKFAATYTQKNKFLLIYYGIQPYLQSRSRIDNQLWHHDLTMSSRCLDQFLHQSRPCHKDLKLYQTSFNQLENWHFFHGRETYKYQQIILQIWHQLSSGQLSYQQTHMNERLLLLHIGNPHSSNIERQKFEMSQQDQLPEHNQSQILTKKLAIRESLQLSCFIEI